ncbi:MAG TPA: nascent polypeptide-associated complex protein [Candidatus Thermoplasmatota archaeon]|nr:nascent polypeptide-associated complex protein [Candidatus Thermoplasmatota archaeon]
MFPGGRMDPRKLSAMMKQLGIDVKTLEDVERIVITTKAKEYVFIDAEVTMMKAQGSLTYQIAGTPKIVDRAPGTGSGAPAAPAAAAAPAAGGTSPGPAVPSFSEADVALVMEQAKVPREKAVKALEDADGEVATAIVNLTGA